MFFLLLLILPGVRNQEPTPSNSRGLGRYVHHPFNAVQFLQTKPTKNGPILFPNDAPPPPPTPLIVTSRPLSESIAKSELNTNNSQTAQSQLNHISFKPEYLARGNSYRPFSYALATVTPLYDYDDPQEHHDEEKKVQENQKDLYYTDFEKRLMETIHRRKDTYREENLWDRPIHRRKIKQGDNGRFDARKTIFSDEDKGFDIKVKHGSLYSREANENNDDDGSDVPVQNLRRMNYEEPKSKNRRRYHKSDSESDGHYSVRKIRPVKNMAIYNKNINTRPFPKPNSVSDFEDRKIQRSVNRESPLQKVKSLRDSYKSRLRRPHQHKDSISDIEDRKREARLYKKAKPQSDSDNTNRNRRPYKKSESLNNNDNRNKKIKPLQKLDLFDNKNKKPVYKTEDQNKKSSYSPKIANNNDNKNVERRSTHRLDSQRRPTRGVDNLRHDNFRNKENKPSQRTEDNKSKDQNKRKIHEEASQERIQHREIRPLYALSDHYNHAERTTRKPYRYKSQEKSPEYSNYFYTNEGNNDASKDYNHGDNYAFSYTVKNHKTGDDFSHSQHSKGSATNGEYRVRLPDGRMQIVSYTADENGYKADVKYDERHHHDNSIDIDTSRENRHHKNDHKNDRPIHFKNNEAFDHFDSQDYSFNRDYVDHPYKNDNAHNLLNEHTSQPGRRPTVARNKHQYQNFVNDNANHNAGHTNDQNAHTYGHLGHKKVNIDAHKDGSITDSNNDYLEHYKDKKYNKYQRGHDTDYFLFSDEVVAPGSKEIVDYSSELNGGYRPHASKFSTFNDNNNVKPTVKPSYDELKDIFVTSLSRRQQNVGVPVVSTAKPDYGVTDNIVVIGAKNHNLYTNIREAAPVTPSPSGYSTPFAPTPSSYLFSTIANLKSQVNLINKPVLSNRYIDKINKYLAY